VSTRTGGNGPFNCFQALTGSHSLSSCAAGPASQRSRQSILSLGIANDLENDIVGDDEEDPRQEAGDSAVSSMGKWHKHTVKVYSMLKDNMAAPGEGQDEAGDEPKPERLSYEKLSTGCSRRTAAGVFFELLQLKTWDYIDLDQDESYGDIKVSHCRMFSLIFVDPGI
jgi:hypothetical protein